MSPIFLDTAGLIAIVNIDDHWHSVADNAWQRLISSPAPLLTTSLVLIEMGDGLSRVNQRRLAWQLRNCLTSSPRIEVVQVTADHEAIGWELFGQRADKEWGMTDCVSMVVARQRQVRDVFSTDHHFEQAGFNLLLLKR